MSYYYDKYLEFVHNFEELSEKYKSLPKNAPGYSDKIKKFYLINQQLDGLNQAVEEFLVSIDQEKFTITKKEHHRIDDTMAIDRAIDRAKPFVYLSLLAETWEDNPKHQFNDDQLDHKITFPTKVTYPK